eukprot:5984884-Prymnesium_polylepis.1
MGGPKRAGGLLWVLEGWLGACLLASRVGGRRKGRAWMAILTRAAAKIDEIVRGSVCGPTVSIWHGFHFSKSPYPPLVTRVAGARPTATRRPPTPGRRRRPVRSESVPAPTAHSSRARAARGRDPVDSEIIQSCALDARTNHDLL